MLRKINMTKQEAIAEAYRCANLTGYTHFALAFGFSWVVRDFDLRLVREPGVIVCSPIGWPNEMRENEPT
jgi:hypothetical protein